MICIFDENKVYRLACPDREIADKMMKNEKETTVEVEKWVKFKMPTLVPDQETGADKVVWVTRQQFDLIRNPPAETEEPEEAEQEDVDMV